MSTFSVDAFAAKLDSTEGVDRAEFISELCRVAGRAELGALLERLRRDCITLHTERVSFISEKCTEVIDAMQTLGRVGQWSGEIAALLGELKEDAAALHE